MAPDTVSGIAPYDPKTGEPPSFHDRVAAFEAGRDTPRAYLNMDGARAMAGATTKRAKNGQARFLGAGPRGCPA